jgi:hypothetical protein
MLIYLFSVVYYAMGVTLKDAFFWVARPSPGHLFSTPVVVLSTLAVGAILFFFRQKLRAFYGLTEVIIGLKVATNRAAASEQVASLQDPDFYLALLTAGIYLVVRGLDNMREGMFGDKARDPWAGWIVQRVKSIVKE